MSKKCISIVIIPLIIIILAGSSCILNKSQQSLSSKIIGESIEGVLVRKGWAKSFESYCAQGSDYFILKTDNEEFVLEFKPIYTETQMVNLSGKNVVIVGERKQRKIKCPEGLQCPLTFDGIFICDVFKVNKINKLKLSNNSLDCNESGRK